MAQSRGQQATRSVSRSHDNYVDGLLSGYAWSGNAIQYAFPERPGSYSYGGEKNHNFEAVGKNIQNAARFILDKDFGNAANDGFSIEGFTNLKISAGSASSAEIRYAESSYSAYGGVNQTAYAYYPSNNSIGGDVWFGKVYDFNLARAGNYYFASILHETGHALGLKHAQSAERGFPALKNSSDSLEYTVMTYNTFVGDNASGYKAEPAGYPQTMMMADIAALQYMYGANYSVNSGKTVYSWSPDSGNTWVNGRVAISPETNRIFATIWDGGGRDTYDLRLFRTDLEIDLRAGHHSVFSQSQLANLNGGPNGGLARGNIFNALLHEGKTASLIENAVGGRGDDVLLGNQAGNKLNGGGGDDTFAGYAGNDIYRGGGGSDTFIFKRGWDHDVINDFQSGRDHVNLKSFDLASFGDLLDKAEQRGDAVFLLFGHGDYIKLAHTDLNHLDAGDFIL